MRDLDERAERPGGEARVAATPQHVCLPVQLLAEAARQRGLADARFPADEHEGSTPTPRVRERLVEPREGLVALEKRGRVQAVIAMLGWLPAA